MKKKIISVVGLVIGLLLIVGASVSATNSYHGEVNTSCDDGFSQYFWYMGPPEQNSYYRDGTSDKLYWSATSPPDESYYVSNKAGFIFRNVTVPRGATLDFAQMYFYPSYTIPYSGHFVFIRSGELSSGGDFCTSNDYGPTFYSYWSTNWYPPAMTQNQRVYSPDLKGALQATINSASWNSGENLFIQFYVPAPGSPFWEAWQYDYAGASYGAKLYIEWH